MAASIVLATTAMLWLLELILLGIWGGAQHGGAPEVAGGSAVLALEALERLPLSAAPVLVTLVVLVFVLGCTEMLRLVLRPRSVCKGIGSGTKQLRR